MSVFDYLLVRQYVTSHELHAVDWFVGITLRSCVSRISHTCSSLEFTRIIVYNTVTSLELSSNSRPAYTMLLPDDGTSAQLICRIIALEVVLRHRKSVRSNEEEMDDGVHVNARRKE